MAVVKSSKLGVPSVTTSLSSSFGSGYERMSPLRLFMESCGLSFGSLDELFKRAF